MYSSNNLSNYASVNLQSGYIKITLSTKFKELGRMNLSIGKESEENYQQATKAVLAIDEYFDKQLATGKAVSVEEIKAIVSRIKRPHLSVVESVVTVKILWQAYVEFHKKMPNLWGEPYILTHIANVTSLVNHVDYPKDIEKPSLAIEWLLSGKRSAKTAKDRFKLIVAAIDWASRNDRCDRHLGIKYRDCLSAFAAKISSNKKMSDDGEIDEESGISLFSVDEIEQILSALENETFSRFKGKHKQYHAYVKFLWLTGCRPSEAIALKWTNVDFAKKELDSVKESLSLLGKLSRKKGQKPKNFVFSR